MLDAELEKLDGLPDAIAKEYVRVELPDGKSVYRLSVKDSPTGFTLMNPAGLMQTIQTLRQHESRAKAYGNVTPEEAVANAKRVAELAAELEAARKGTPDIEARISAAVKDAVTKRDRENETVLSEANRRAELRLKEIQRAKKVDAARLAAMEAGFREPEVLELIVPKLADLVDVVEDENAKRDEDRYRPVIRDQDGNPREVYEKTKTGTVNRPMTVADLAREFAGDKFKRFVSVEKKADTSTTPTGRRVTAPAYDTPNDDVTPRAPANPLEMLANAFGAS